MQVFFKANSSAPFLASSDLRAGTGIIICDSDGSFLPHCGSVDLAETICIREGVFLALDTGFRHLQMETIFSLVLSTTSGFGPQGSF